MSEKSKRIKIIVSAVGIIGAFGFVLASSMKDADALTYFVHADEVIAAPQPLLGQRIKVGGKVQKGTILQRKGTLEYRFGLRPIEGMLKHPEALGKTLTIAYTGVVPDTFKDDADVVVTGTLHPDGTFVAQDMIGKCPSRDGYNAATETKDLASTQRTGM